MLIIVTFVSLKMKIRGSRLKKNKEFISENQTFPVTRDMIQKKARKRGSLIFKSR